MNRRDDSPAVRRKLLRWYDRAHRTLPWRISPASAAQGLKPDPYLVLVSETMLQQTQVATVIPYFKRFVRKYPTVRSLARSSEHDVLRLWQGLGYYSRARNLRKAARTTVADFGGEVPGDVDSLLRLPGVGRYTAGAIASIAFGRAEPILDGNVARVICRLDRIESADPRDRETVKHLWTRASELVPKRRPGDFNQALMELGALVCTPRNPQCLACPVREHCRSFAAGLQDRIPAPRKARATPLERRWTLCVQSGERFLIEQRPPRGRWAGMWQFVTIESNALKPTPETLRVARAVEAGSIAHVGRVHHSLTHRRYEFDVYHATAISTVVPNGIACAGRPMRWVRLGELSDFPLPKPHLQIAAMIAAMPVSGVATAP